jgi:hypothetical protein
MARIDAGRGRRITASGRGTAPGMMAQTNDLGLSAIGNELNRQQANRDREEERRRALDDNLTVARETGEVRVALSRMLDEASEAYDGSEPGFADALSQSMDTLITERLGAHGQDVAGPLAVRLQGVRDTALLSAERLESGRREAWRLRTVQDTAQRTSNAITSDPSLYFGAMDDVEDLAAAAGPAMAQSVAADIRRDWTRNYLTGRIAEDAEGALAEIDGGGFDGHLRDGDKQALRRSAETEIRRLAAEAERRAREERFYARLAMSPLAEDHVASIAATGQGVDGFDPDTWLSVLEPAEAQRWSRSLRQAHAVHEALGDLPDLPIDAMQDRLAGLRPAPGSAGYADAERLYDAARQSVSGEIRARLEDPAAAAARSGAVQAARDAMAAAEDEDAPGAMTAATERYGDAVLAEQERLGLPPAQRRLLTRAEAAAIAAQHEEAEDRPRALREIMAGTREWGGHADRALRELTEAGLPPAAALAAALGDDPAAQTRFAQALSERSELENLVPRADRNRIGERLSRELAPLAETFEASPNALAQTAAVMEAAEALAMRERVRNGQGLNDAARTAARAFTERYALRDGYRIPADVARGVELGDRRREAVNRDGTPQGPRRVRAADLIARGADAALDALTGDDGARLLPTEPGADFLGAARLTADGLRRGGRWATRPDETGLMLMAERDDFLVPARGADGRPIELDWDELAELGRARSSGAAPAAAYDRMTAIRAGEDPDAPAFRPRGGRGRATGEGARNWPIVRQRFGDDQ